MAGTALFAAPASAEEAIRAFHADIAVARDGTVHVVETIQVEAEGDQIRHGIYRDVSTTFEDAQGKLHRIGFKLVGLTRDGRPEPSKSERHSDYLRLYAGDADVVIDPGVHTYVLTYETDREIHWFDGQPELYWNVTGNDWAFPILAASARLTLPGNVSPERWAAYTGGVHERGTDFAGSVDSSGALTVGATRRLAPGEGLSIVAGIPAGAVDPPSSQTDALYFLRDHLEWVIGIAGLALVLGYYLWAWNRVGRDPKGGTIIPLFHPPAGISPALAGYIRNWGFGGNSWKAFTAAALSLAVRGLIVFDQEGKDLVFERTKLAADPVGDTLAPDERVVLDWVEAAGGRAEINRANGSSVAEIGAKFEKSVAVEGSNRYFRRNLPHFALGLVLSLLVVGGIVLFGGLSDDELGILFGALFVGIFVSFFVVPIVMSLFSGRGRGTLLASLFSLVLVLGFAFSWLAGLANDVLGANSPSLLASLEAHALPLALVLLLPAINGLFYYLLKAPTAEGRPVMDQIEGFRIYMETAESGRLNIAGAPEITGARFEALLPFAVALGVEQPWASAFQTAFARAHPGDANAMAYYSPGWRRGGSWSNQDFGRTIASTVTGATSAMQSAMPRPTSSSSGFSGGGGSGGGGGGRGGGGW